MVLLNGLLRLNKKAHSGWVERSETQQYIGNVGFPASTQPTQLKLIPINIFATTNLTFLLLQQELYLEA